MQDSDLINMAIDRGERAQRLLDDPLIQHVLATLEDEAVKRLKAVDSKDAEGRDSAWRELRAIDAFTKRFKSYMITGKQAKKSLYAKAKEAIRS
jgi:hypothetical protein